MLRNFFAREECQGLVEYALNFVLIAIVVIGSLSVLGPAFRRCFRRLTWASVAKLSYFATGRVCGRFCVNETPGSCCATPVFPYSASS
jgi:pilus assembly protein Flp/PilA